MNIQHKIILLTISIFQLAGCANTELVYHTRDFNSQEIDIITILPVLDARLESFVEDDFSEETEEFQSIILDELEDSGYTVNAVSDPEILENISPSQVPFLSADQVRKIDLINTSWLLLPVVIGLQTYNGVIPGFGEIVFYLFEKHSGKLVWEGSSTDSYLEGATEGLIDEFPDK